MVRIFILIIFVAIAMLVFYFLTTGVNRMKIMTLIGGGAFAAFVGLFMQGALSVYLSIAAIVAISLLGALIYAKVQETNLLKRQQVLQEHKNRKSKISAKQAALVKKPVHEPIGDETSGMQTITRVREEQKVE